MAHLNSLMTHFKPLYGVIILACCLCAGVVLNILACAYGSWFLLFALLVYLLLPLPKIVFGRREDDDPFASGPNNIVHAGNFISGFLVISGLAIPTVLYHGEMFDNENHPDWMPLVLSISGGVVVYSSIFAYLHFYHNRSEEDQVY